MNNLFGIVQGGMVKALRSLSAEQITAIDFPGFAVITSYSIHYTKLYDIPVKRFAYFSFDQIYWC